MFYLAFLFEFSCVTVTLFFGIYMLLHIGWPVFVVLCWSHFSSKASCFLSYVNKKAVFLILNLFVPYCCCDALPLDEFIYHVAPRRKLFFFLCIVFVLKQPSSFLVSLISFCYFLIYIYVFVLILGF